jgi:hypothetical protein
VNSLGKYCKTDALETPSIVKFNKNVFRNNRIISLVHSDGLHFYLRSHEEDGDKKKCVKCDLSWVLCSGEGSVVWSCLLQWRTLHTTLRTTHNTLLITHYTLHYALHTTHYTLHTTLNTLRTTHYALHTTHYALHCALHTTHYSLRTTHYALHTAHYTLHTTVISMRVTSAGQVGVGGKQRTSYKNIRHLLINW